ncbi:MAG: response regulator [Candidatus Thiodiazotropha sp. (ex Dulcina madagascariensis)]|nr:response regulator [Candidatus Thiodiazotropha sp. (ex Dulcina madagascariensis)]MCU7924909.1 response regulator [Candidatus Thiodiazotropha sp. (ex Dulcina madagascariensis)]
MNKRALIVDDSKTARQVLSGKLSKYGIAVEARESAAAAIDYLYENTPDAIFMDYEMPGMDGFQALKVIKSNPRTAVIPVMMYTSKAGDLALSQARALGAVGVLPKQLEPQDLEGVLESLHLMPEQKSLVHDFRDDELEGVGRIRRRDNIHPIDRHERRKAAPVEPVSLPLESFQDTGSGQEPLKRFIHREQEQTEARIQEKIDKHFAEIQGELYELEALHEASVARGRRGVLAGFAGGVFLVIGLLLIYYFFASTSPGLSSMDRERELSDAILDLIRSQNEKIERLVLPTGEGVAGNVKAGDSSQLPIRLIEWAANQGAEYEFGEMAFNDQRALWLTELVELLKEAGFRGTLELRANHGNFCLQKDGNGAFSLAEPGLAIDECLFVADQRRGYDWQNDQSVSFANYLNVESSRNGGEVEILLFSNGLNDPLVPYPAPYELKTAGEWNRIAGQNQRVRVSLYSNY